MADEKNVDELSPEQLVEEIDNAQENIMAFEQTPKFKHYLGFKVFQDACSDRLREVAAKSGDFRSKYFQFQKIEQVVLCRNPNCALC